MAGANRGRARSRLRRPFAKVAVRIRPDSGLLAVCWGASTLADVACVWHLLVDGASAGRLNPTSSAFQSDGISRRVWIHRGRSHDVFGSRACDIVGIPEARSERHLRLRCGWVENVVVGDHCWLSILRGLVRGLLGRCRHHWRARQRRQARRRADVDVRGAAAMRGLSCRRGWCSWRLRVWDVVLDGTVVNGVDGKRHLWDVCRGSPPLPGDLSLWLVRGDRRGGGSRCEGRLPGLVDR